MAEHRDDIEFLLRQAVRSALIDTHTALPGRIQSYDAATQTADVVIELEREFEGDRGVREAVAIAPIPDVPVLHPRAGGYAITLPVQAGDPCLLVFSERDLSGWLQTGQPAVPASARRHDYADAVAILGLSPSPNALSPAPAGDGIEIRSDDGTTVVKVGADVDITAAGAVSIDSGGAVTLTRGPSELLDLMSQALQALATDTVASVPLTNAATYAALKVLIDAMKA